MKMILIGLPSAWIGLNINEILFPSIFFSLLALAALSLIRDQIAQNQRG